MGILDFFALPGQERTRRRDEYLGGLLNYYLGPTGIPERLGLVDMLNPVSDVGRAMTSSQEMLAPDRTPMERVGAGATMLTDIASVAAPAAATRIAGGDAAQSMVEGLLGTPMAVEEAGRRVVERLNQPGPVPTMYSNPLGRAPGEGGGLTLYRGTNNSGEKISGGIGEGYLFASPYEDVARLYGDTVERMELPDSARVLTEGTKEFAEVTGRKRGPLLRTMRAGESLKTAADEAIKRAEAAGYDAVEFNSMRDMGVAIINPSIVSRADPAIERGQEVLRMLREGRASEVTDDMLDLGDPTLNARLNMYLYDNYDLPMDEASRAARARQAGRVDDQYHATTADFSAFLPSQTGLAGKGVYTGDFATDVTDYARADGTEGLSVIPVRAPQEGSYARRIDWQNTVDSDPDFPYNATVDETIAGFSRAADTMSGQGYSGVLSQPGERVTFDPRNIRSRFARFDPRLAHLRNLSAGVGGLGLLTTQTPEQRDEEIRQYLGGLL